MWRHRYSRAWRDGDFRRSAVQETLVALPTPRVHAGLGPEIIHATGVEAGTFWGISAVVDFMFWQSKHVGWYLEPGYEATFRNGVMRHGFATAAGLLIGR
jgi:hypothetical protein